ncbi:MAG: PD40 domain-containing protein [Dehalococcoidales bacterium]|nr:MAG: PD40 domain-containing protein [Dehalococcoidales bacterium]
MLTRTILISLVILASSFIFIFTLSCTPTDTDVIDDTSPPTENPIKDTNGSSTDSENILVEHNRIESVPDNAIKMSPENDLYPPILHSSEFNDPVPMPSPINTAGGEDSPFITPDGKTFYVFFTPDVSLPAEKQVLDGVTGIYVSHLLDDGSWSEPQRVSLGNGLSLDGCAFVQGDRMWFCSVREGYNGINWFTADNTDGQWQNLKFSNLNLLKGYEVGELHITSDGNEMYFHSSRPGGLGGYDIWVCRNIDSEWQEPINVKIVNSPDTDGWPYVSQDGRELWFTRFYQGSPALFRSIRTNNEWQEPELIVSQFAGEPTLDNKGNLYFTHHYYENGVMLEADIYVAKKK